MKESSLNKKPVIFFAVGDQNNSEYAVKFWNSMVKFHDPKEIDMIYYTNETRPEVLKRFPQGIVLEDLTPYTQNDPIFFYRQKPILAEPLLDKYELVVGFDVDQIICGDLNYILETKDYDVAVVVNWNRSDPQIYGYVEIMRLGIQPIDYYNCGLVAMRSKQFVHHWKVLCFEPEFNYMQYKEQDVLNVLAHFGNYNVRNLDTSDGIAKYYSWHGLISKGEMTRFELRGENIVCPKGFGDTPFPPNDFEIRVIHFAEGNKPNKMEYRTLVSEEVAKRLDYLVSPKI